MNFSLMFTEKFTLFSICSSVSVTNVFKQDRDRPDKNEHDFFYPFLLGTDSRPKLNWIEVFSANTRGIRARLGTGKNWSSLVCTKPFC